VLLAIGGLIAAPVAWRLLRRLSAKA